MKKNITALVIMDGFGISENKKYNPIYLAKKPTLDYLLINYPNAILQASGKYVGLPEGYIGNSEVGHLTIGAGKIISQACAIINAAIEDQSFFKNQVLTHDLTKLYNANGDLHIIGLLSDAGVHSHEKHLYAFLRTALNCTIKKIYIHLILDGRDVAPESAAIYLTRLQDFIEPYTQISIGSIQGRFYAMDRDNNYQRTKQSLELLTTPQEINFKNWKDAINNYYTQNISDEFIPPTQLDSLAIVKDNDGIIFFNFRPDRARQLTTELLKLNLSFLLTPVSYGSNIETDIMFQQQPIKDTLMDILAEMKLQTFSIAETEKYAHITYFFKGGRENLYPNETQVLISSIKSNNNYIDNPTMSANKITDAIIYSLEHDPKDFYLINYANADMVGHSGDFDATVKAIECLDKQLKKLYEEIVLKRNGTLYITSDHGNAELKFDENTGQTSKAHTTNPVPFIFVRKDVKDQNITMPLTQLANIKDFIIKNIQ
ncbi:MAG: 2,3-bisphosphoglycerate-independent phosphoglycerate mutase [Candidatus Babeliales bacterium]|nr:2,3-bisphosphoglycerate-independent phosphoglycerate mutase [Candidatus Babeliales bacterium]